jgi:hypothetical protein
MEHLPQPADVDFMLRLLNGHCLEQALYVVALLGIADALIDGPKSSDELAQGTGADGPSLHRLLRALTSLDIFHEEPDGCFALTPLAATLRSDVVNSVRDRAIYYGTPEMWNVWGNLLHCVLTGQSACEHAHSTTFYDYLTKNPNIGAPFNRYMSKTSEQHNASLVQSYDFAPLNVLVDVGGGHGAALVAIMRRYPKLQGILFDLPQVVEQASVPDRVDFAGRWRIVGGDMQQSVPSGADAYLLKWVLMDRSDRLAAEVLRNCSNAMADGGRVLVVEMVMPDNVRGSFSAIMDLQMMLVFGQGRIRTEQEFRNLFESAGLALTQVHSTQSPNKILEDVRT